MPHGRRMRSCFRLRPPSRTSRPCESVLRVAWPCAGYHRFGPCINFVTHTQSCTESNEGKGTIRAGDHLVISAKRLCARSVGGSLPPVTTCPRAERGKVTRLLPQPFHALAENAARRRRQTRQSTRAGRARAAACPVRRPPGTAHGPRRAAIPSKQVGGQGPPGPARAGRRGTCYRSRCELRAGCCCPLVEDS